MIERSIMVTARALSSDEELVTGGRGAKEPAIP